MTHSSSSHLKQLDKHRVLITTHSRVKVPWKVPWKLPFSKREVLEIPPPDQTVLTAEYPDNVLELK